MLTTKITFELADWIKEWRKSRNESPSLDNCFQFVQWKMENYTLTTVDKLQIEIILLYETVD
tara:strand:- start:78 stop:263 length:186 start_codon:yes stop_codon:yes gene_type:complete